MNLPARVALCLPVPALWAFAAWAPGSWLSASAPFFAAGLAALLVGLGYWAWLDRAAEDDGWHRGPEIILPWEPDPGGVDLDEELERLLSAGVR